MEGRSVDIDRITRRDEDEFAGIEPSGMRSVGDCDGWAVRSAVLVKTNELRSEKRANNHVIYALGGPCDLF